MPVEPPPTRWKFPRTRPTDSEVVGLGADLAPATILAAYRQGLFPMPVGGSLAWWSPDPRGVLPLEGLHLSRSLRRSCRRFEIRVDTAFSRVLGACANPDREGAWIDSNIAAAYVELHRMGWAHSVETWMDDRLVGGLYGLAIGGLFAGESMFHHETDASKVALVALVERLNEDVHPDRLLDVQWCTDHLATLGVVDIPRVHYERRLAAALALPLPPAFS